MSRVRGRRVPDLREHARREREQQHAEDQDRDRVADPPRDTSCEVHREVVVEPGHRVAPIAPDRGAFLDRRRGLGDEVATDLGSRSDHHVAVEDDDVSLDGSGDVHVPVQDPQGLLDRPIHLCGSIQDHRGVDGLVLCDDEPTCQHDLIVRGRRAVLCESRSRQERSRSIAPVSTMSIRRMPRTGGREVVRRLLLITSTLASSRNDGSLSRDTGWMGHGRLRLSRSKKAEARSAAQGAPVRRRSVSTRHAVTLGNRTSGDERRYRTDGRPAEPRTPEPMTAETRTADKEEAQAGRQAEGRRSRGSPLWTKAPLALVRYPGLLAAVVVGALLLSLVAAAFPLFLSRSEGDLLRARIMDPTVGRNGAGLFYSITNVGFREKAGAARSSWPTGWTKSSAGSPRKARTSDPRSGSSSGPMRSSPSPGRESLSPARSPVGSSPGRTRRSTST